MEKHALDVQAMQCAVEERMNQAQHSLEARTKMAKHHKTTDGSEEEHELSSAFEMLHTQDKTNGIGDSQVKCKTIDFNRVETGSGLMDTAVSSKSCGKLEETKTVITEVENLWSRIVSLADKIGVDRQKILLVKNI